jgi:hypothetical protein
MIAVIVSPMHCDGLWTLAAPRICPRHRDFSVIASLSLRNLQFCLIKRNICISKALERDFQARNRRAAATPIRVPFGRHIEGKDEIAGRSPLRAHPCRADGFRSTG